MTTPVIFVHSPLVGPSSLVRLRDAAASVGRRVSLPDLTGVADTADPHEYLVATAAAAANRLDQESLAIVGHSGAGAFLPAIVSQTRAFARVVFLDAVIPPRNGPHRSGDAMLRLVEQQTQGIRLRPWLDWWPPDVVEKLVPLTADLEAIRADMPRLPASFYQEDIEVPTGWDRGGCGYVKLSDAYAAEFAEARSRGWRSVEVASSHLASLTEPEVVLRAITSVIENPDVRQGDY